uniref:Uncharacterized protein n=1 Tax=Panagrolaimus sp. PS1159 TaxID=55785 RepID=A0AC35G3I1_9BILA
MIVAFTPDIQTLLLTAVTSISLYCQQLKLGSTCSILTKYYQPNKNVMNVYEISNETLNGTLLRSFKTDDDLLLYYPDYQYISEQTSLLHTFERKYLRTPYSMFTYYTNGPKTPYSMFTYYTNEPKFDHSLKIGWQFFRFDLCFSNMNQFYCMQFQEYAFVLVRQPSHETRINNFDKKIKFYAFDYCISSLVFEGENDYYLVS